VAARRGLRRAAAPRPAPPARRGRRDQRGGSEARGRAPRERPVAMTLFVVLGALLVAAAVLFIVPPLARKAARPGASRDAVNAAVYRDQLRELEADVDAG